MKVLRGINELKDLKAPERGMEQKGCILATYLRAAK
jgi:hypothetical protein